jgi:hypothetical protein
MAEDHAGLRIRPEVKNRPGKSGFSRGPQGTLASSCGTTGPPGSTRKHRSATVNKPTNLHAIDTQTLGEATLADPFSPENLRLSQSFAETVGVKKLLTTVPVRKPSPQDFVRVHPKIREDFPLLELKDDREEFIVAPSMLSELADEVVPKTLFLAVNRQGVAFFWPVRLPGADGRDLDWWRSAREAAAMAVDNWVRVRANMSLGAYDVFQAEGIHAEPDWPELDLGGLLKLAFRNNLIDRPDHPIIDRLRGRK